MKHKIIYKLYADLAIYFPVIYLTHPSILDKILYLNAYFTSNFL